MQCPSCGHDYREAAAFCAQCGASLGDAPGTAAVRDALPQAFVGGRYVVERLLGEGAKKLVYLAHDRDLDRAVAFALLRIDGLDAESVIRLRQEAQAMGRLGGHPNIVTVFDIGEDPGPPARPYIVSECMLGGDVATLLRESEGRRLPVEGALRIAQDVCRGLEHAHAHGVVHRDLKPGNVWLAEDGTAKLGDFGLALMDDRTRMSQEGLLYGTPLYMSPEQALGNNPDARSDLYALGVMLYEMVSGRPPFVGDDPVAVISQHIETAPLAPAWHNPEVPRALEALILRLLAKAPERRPESARTVHEVLGAISSTAAGMVGEGEADVNPLDCLAAGVFVGRERETDELRAALEGALSGRGRLVTLVGEPGIGKTRIADELATYAHLRGAEVLWGRCYEGEGAPAYWPWTQIIRAYARDHDPEVLLAEMGPGAGDIGHLVPQIRQSLADLPVAAPLDSEQARFRLFDSVSTFLANAARRRPLVLVLDDLHVADKPSLLLLRFLAWELRHARMLVVGTYRDVQLGRHHPLAETIGELVREQHAARIVLRGIDKEDVARFIELSAAVTPPDGLVTAVLRETDGNPLFVSEVVRLLVAEGRLDRIEEGASWTMTIPEGVREAIGRRLDRLSDACNSVLRLASVMGREFELPALERVSDLSEEELMDAFEEAIRARVVVEVPHGRGRYRFSHALIQEVLYAELPSPRRARLHARIGEALENLHAATLELHLDELAHHFVEAAHAGQVEKGIDYAARAGAHAAGRLAYEEAAAYYEQALEAMDMLPRPDDEHRCDLVLAAGEAHARAADFAKAMGAFGRGADLACALADPERLARAALGYGRGWGGFGIVDETLVGLLEQALAALGEHDSAPRAMVLARLAAELYYSGLRDRRMELSSRAVEMARRLGDPATLGYALNGRHRALWGPENAQDRLALAREIIELADRAGDRELALRGRALCVVDLLELGDLVAADAEIAVHAALAQELREPFQLWHAAVWRAMRALCDGRFDDAERLANDAFAAGRRLRESDAAQFQTVQLFFCRVDQGRAGEMEEPFKRFVRDFPTLPGWRAGLAFLYCEAGRESEARREFAALAANGFRDIPRDDTWLLSTVAAADACGSLGDAAAAAVLYELLLPYAERNIVCFEAGIACIGAAARVLGVLARTMGRWEESDAHFEAALELNEQMGARPWLARTQQQYADMLLARDEPSDRHRAVELRTAAVATARELGMKSLLNREVPVS
jgi:tetratricopeptide (TPR) repeat protein